MTVKELDQLEIIRQLGEVIGDEADLQRRQCELEVEVCNTKSKYDETCRKHALLVDQLYHTFRVRG